MGIFKGKAGGGRIINAIKTAVPKVINGVANIASSPLGQAALGFVPGGGAVAALAPKIKGLHLGQGKVLTQSGEVVHDEAAAALPTNAKLTATVDTNTGAVTYQSKDDKSLWDKYWTLWGQKRTMMIVIHIVAPVAIGVGIWAAVKKWGKNKFKRRR